MSSWGSYPSIFNFGHKAIKELLEREVNVEEKVDGSQFSFGLVEPNFDEEGKAVDPVWNVFDHKQWSLKVRSKGAIMHVDAPPAMFKKACETVKRLAEGAQLGGENSLHPGWTYRGEVLDKPKHNSLTYDRIPTGNIILFDVNTEDQEYLNYEDKVKEAARLGLECVPRLFTGKIEGIDEFRKFLETTSILGGQKIEGVVVKPVNYDLFGTDKKVLMGKFVSEAFKEVHRKVWGESNPGRKDVIDKLVSSLATPARWNKALIHLKEAGKIEGSLRDIGLIINEIPGDIRKEEEGWIKDVLFNHFWKEISRGCVRGVAQWYKDTLLAQSFETQSRDN